MKKKNLKGEKKKDLDERGTSFENFRDKGLKVGERVRTQVLREDVLRTQEEQKEFQGSN